MGWKNVGMTRCGGVIRFPALIGSGGNALLRAPLGRALIVRFNHLRYSDVAEYMVRRAYRPAQIRSFRLRIITMGVEGNRAVRIRLDLVHP